MRERDAAKLFASMLNKSGLFACHIWHDTPPNPANLYTFTRPSDAMYFTLDGYGGYIEFKTFPSETSITPKSFINKLRTSQKDGLTNAARLNIPYIGCAYVDKGKIYSLCNLSDYVNNKDCFFISGTIERFFNEKALLLAILIPKISANGIFEIAVNEVVTNMKSEISTDTKKA